MDSQSLSSLRNKLDLFFVSVIILFLELACIRWFCAHVLYLTFFTNVILLGCFLGISVGCLAAGRKYNLLRWTPTILAGALGLGLLSHVFTESLQSVINVGNAAESPEVVFFGTEYFFRRDIAKAVIPVEVFCGVFFVLSALIMVGPGQEMGRAFGRVPNRLHAYMLNIIGSIVGIILFAACSFAQLNPFWWFMPVAIGIGYYIFSKKLLEDKKLYIPIVVLLFIIPTLSSVVPGMSLKKAYSGEYSWSPYYLVHYDPARGSVNVNNISHQSMISRNDPDVSGHPYAFPHLLQRDSGGSAFKNVLIIGAGTGNDLSRALQWGAERVDAVDIDPVIIRIGKQYHPDQPYQDPRVHIYQDDGRNFLRITDRKYDLIVYALVDSLVLHSSANNIRLESFLFTNEAFKDIKGLLTDNGVFVLYNFFRQGWIIGRLSEMLKTVFGSEPMVFHFPPSEFVTQDSKGGFTLVMSGDTQHLEKAFDQHNFYSVPIAESPQPNSRNGFLLRQRDDDTLTLKLAKVVPPKELTLATDNWPFLYLQRPMIPDINIRGIIIMAIISLILILMFVQKAEPGYRSLNFNGQMFFLGAGFMLIETKSVVQMSLLFGSTWMVNSLIFLMVLIMILAANIFVIRYKPQNQIAYYSLLFLALGMNSIIPLNYFLGMEGFGRVLGSSLLVFAPIFFAGVVFSMSFGRSKEPNVDLGSNIAGAMAGGFAEYSSTLLGFQHLVFVSMAFYLLSVLMSKKLVSLWKVNI
jgi:spermidine synthase